MNVRMMLGTALLATGLFAHFGPAVAQDHRERTHEVCHNVRVRDRPKDDHRIAGTAIGAVAGGLLGHQIGGGKGKTLATVGGAVAGGYVGNRVQKSSQEKHAGYHIERRCERVRN